MSAAQKILYSILLSVIVFAGITILAFTGIINLPIFNLPREANIFVFAAFFITLFLTIFFCFNLRPYHWYRDTAIKDESTAEPEYLESVSPFSSTMPLLNNDSKINDSVFELEDIPNGYYGGISLFSRPFAFYPDNPKMLQGISHIVRHDAWHGVLYEENGIHYIDDRVFDNDGEMEKELNNDFAKLVESVINKI